MKIFKPLFLSFVFTLLFSGLMYAQDQIDATLSCDVAALEAGTPAYEACSFVNQEPGTDTREYTIYAEIGDTIIWRGESTDGSAAIDIRKIKYDRGTNVFNKPELDGETTVEGTVKRNTNGEPYKYTITFKINNTGGNYKIDPKIKSGGGGQ
jgi:hypothetical protein